MLSWGCSDSNWGGDWLDRSSYLRVQVVSETDVISGEGVIVDSRVLFKLYLHLKDLACSWITQNVIYPCGMQPNP